MKTPTKVCGVESDQLRTNIEIHDRISGEYDQRHGEIFNDIEQRRLHDALGRAIEFVRSGSDRRIALDFGCGSGNLTRHLLDLDMTVVAADVSERFLSLVQQRFGTSRLTTYRLNGRDFGGIADSSFDLVAGYSVLHHVPDYLSAVREMARVCRRGGVIYLDHEPPKEYWSDPQAHERFKAEVASIDWRKFLVWGNYVGKLRRFFDPKYANEGDIHVWPDDHVEWELIEEQLLSSGFELVFEEDYLLYRRGYDFGVYERYKDELTDMRLMAFRKL